MNNVGAIVLLETDDMVELYSLRSEGDARAQARARLAGLGDLGITVTLFGEPSCPARHKWSVAQVWMGAASNLKGRI